MEYETVGSLRLPKIGFGTWTIGGQGSPNYADDGRAMRALRSALDLGYTHFDTAEYYAGGHAEELLGQAIRESGLNRQDLIITTKVSPEHLAYDNVLRCCERSLQRLGMEYVDLYLIHWPSPFIKLTDTFKAMNKLAANGKVRHLGVSNFNLKLLQQAAGLAETPLLTDQVSYSIPDRTYEKNGVLAWCQNNDVLLTAYSPVKRRFIAGNKPLQEVAKARGVTTHQIALAWLVRQPRLITIPLSFDPQHQADNLAAADLELTETEIAQFDIK